MTTPRMPAEPPFTGPLADEFFRSLLRKYNVQEDELPLVLYGAYGAWRLMQAPSSFPGADGYLRAELDRSVRNALGVLRGLRPEKVT
jgi:hypothetical protein